MTKKHKGIPRQLVYGLYLERHGPLRHIFFRPIWNHTTYHPQSLTSHSLLIVSCILPTTSVCVATMTRQGLMESLCKRVKEKSRGSCHRKALTIASSFPILMVVALSTKFSSFFDATFSITPPFP
ncbi:hypothetical protein BDA96_07G036400 [Sorghum bicolor]|uniref:Uncharacterized protein n=2 Tax=Sorghum bicolor TaxID=4558 RepID=A0A921U9A1_SORBI|nr:hypothetical protein BDA96_07G036400 [Sorghum bicolor]OQU79852.1 hypothetical protein SORBI_3007G034650 [Sorghum bicolor]